MVESRETPRPGMTLRGDRLLRYVSAFCPHCHAEEGGRVWRVCGCPDAKEI